MNENLTSQSARGGAAPLPARWSYVATLGHVCAVNYQVARWARARGAAAPPCGGPFDWLGIDLRQIRRVLEGKFVGFFSPASVTLADAADVPAAYWKMTDASGARSWHQLRRDARDSEPTAQAWFEHGQWLGIRLQAWRSNLSARQGRILFIRNEDPFVRDEDEDIVAVVEMLRREVVGKFLFAWVRHFDSASPLQHPGVMSFKVRRAWPIHLTEGEVDYDHDYGSGTAWRGHDQDWDSFWAKLGPANEKSASSPEGF